MLVLWLLPGLCSAVYALAHPPEGLGLRHHARQVGVGLRQHLLRTGVVLACLPFEAGLQLAAIARTLVRMTITQRHLLQWAPRTKAALHTIGAAPLSQPVQARPVARRAPARPLSATQPDSGGCMAIPLHRSGARGHRRIPAVRSPARISASPGSCGGCARTSPDRVWPRSGACVLDGATIKRYGFVGAGAVVGPGKVVGEGELWLGNPARLARTLSDKEIESLHYSAQHYVRLKDQYLGVPAGD
ncbi:hypothetical protein QUF31_21405 [Dickeya chrysanthemi]|uniref:gamma carbonic anhydrase family protein n=1 Tax=Dickeya chrysanthemi TaxID=556 RepID=UPI0025A2C63C|nr:hypothetical protein [Dickeya chrysanthemi]WJM85518.1 hypothetical protein QUF31_21405 [Dickeya chrysanthemi]